ncbi:MAG: hypothetical protein J6M60_02615 [Clostridia bacterium]|nr:hypothetical protein [Clostridia bacterium]
MDDEEKFLRREECMNVDEEINNIHKELASFSEEQKKQPHIKVIKISLYFFMILIALLGGFLIYLIYIRDGESAFRIDSSMFPNMF